MISIILILLFVFSVLSVPVCHGVISGLYLYGMKIFPGLFIWFSNLLGFVTMSNMVIAMFIFILLMITIMLTIIVSGQQKKITLLIQELSILKNKKR